MNNKIARQLNQCRTKPDPKTSANDIATRITHTHNNAVADGFLELPTLEFSEAYVEDETISLGVRPKAGFITINDLFNLKTAWGADDINILTGDSGAIELVFKK